MRRVLSRGLRLFWPSAFFRPSRPAHDDVDRDARPDRDNKP